MRSPTGVSIALTALGFDGFDVAVGDDKSMTFRRWMSAADLATHLHDLPHAANSGDVYCVSANAGPTTDSRAGRAYPPRRTATDLPPRPGERFPWPPLPGPAPAEPSVRGNTSTARLRARYARTSHSRAGQLPHGRPAASAAIG